MLTPIKFKNPFREEPNVDEGKIVGPIFEYLEAMRWEKNTCCNMIEAIIDEINNTTKLLYLSIK